MARGASAGLKRLAVVTAGVMVSLPSVSAGCGGGLAAGPINLEMATPWLAAAIEENIGKRQTPSKVGGTRSSGRRRIRIAVRIRNIIVRDRDRASWRAHRRRESDSPARAVDGTASRREPQLWIAELAVRMYPPMQCDGFRRPTRKPLASRRSPRKKTPCIAPRPFSVLNPRAPVARDVLRPAFPGGSRVARKADCSPASIWLDKPEPSRASMGKTLNESG